MHLCHRWADDCGNCWRLGIGTPKGFLHVALSPGSKFAKPTPPSKNWKWEDLEWEWVQWDSEWPEKMKEYYDRKKNN